MKEMEEQYKQSLAEYDEKRVDIIKENENLNEKVELLNARIADLNARLDAKRENDEKIRQTVMSEMIVKTNQLKAEKRDLELKLTETEKQLQDLKADVKEATSGLNGMSEKLQKQLKDQVDVCGEIIKTWEAQHVLAVKEIEDQVK